MYISWMETYPSCGHNLMVRCASTLSVTAPKRATSGAGLPILCA
jgi:hypothetical protein